MRTNVPVLILAEKPSQAKAYSSAYEVETKDKHSITLKPNKTFPNGAIITWGIGHLIGLQPPQDYKKELGVWKLSNLPIFPEPFIYTPNEHTRSHYDQVAKLINSPNIEEVVIGTDCDREGEAIAHLIINQAGASNKKIKRLWINSLEVDSIRKGFENLKDGADTYNLFLEAQARQKSDWLIGMNFSPYFSLHLQNKGIIGHGSFSVGRIQIPLVVLINERQKEIENFVSKPFYRLEANFTHAIGSYIGKADYKTDTKDEIAKVLQDKGIDLKDSGVIKSIEKKEKRTLAKRLHSLSSLQSEANKRWKYTPSDVLRIAQTLYEKKLLTYPRTDSNFITTGEFEYIKNNVDSYKEFMKVDFKTKSLEQNKRFVDNEKVQEHFAIVPTKQVADEKTFNELSDQEKNIYREVMLTTLCMFAEDYIYEETTILTDVKEIEFKTIGKTEIEKGWKAIVQTAEKEDEDNQNLPLVAESDPVQSKLEIIEGFTKPPKPYTEGQLINLMKTCGKYVEENDEVAILKEIEGIGTEATRAGVIERVKEQNYIEVKKNIVYVTEKGQIICEAVKGTLLASPTMTAKWELYLQKIGEGTGNQEAFIQNTKNFIEKTIAETNEKIENNDKIVALKEQAEEKNYITDCPICKKGHIIDKNKVYACTGESNGCKFVIFKKISEKNLSEKMIKTLCEKGTTAKLKGFKSKKGKAFEAKLKLNEGKVEFDFS
ncbi:type IA DNA topoisomerase [Sporosarcina sp. BP05]|uniref:type IA DNA topoisomerase n=1 Tax=Sporosarcina sp. BP05 TaxID=2758726 RepID=UPI001645BCB1|nr:type IA DNA topoisomerase [Sporosarcina sp. BP05]